MLSKTMAALLKWPHFPLRQWLKEKKVLYTLNWTFHHKKASLCFPWVLLWEWRPAGQAVWGWVSQCIESNWPKNTAALLSSFIQWLVHRRFLPVRPTHTHQAQEPPTNPHWPTQGNSPPSASLQSSVVCVPDSLPLWPAEILGALPGHLWIISVFGWCLCS